MVSIYILLRQPSIFCRPDGMWGDAFGQKDGVEGLAGGGSVGYLSELGADIAGVKTVSFGNGSAPSKDEAKPKQTGRFSKYLNDVSPTNNENTNSLFNTSNTTETIDSDVRINTKNKTVEVTPTTDTYDRIFVNGKEIMATKPRLLAPDLEAAGYKLTIKGPQGVGMGLTDFVLEAFNLITGAGELKMGLTQLSKSSVGLRVLGGASKTTLKSSVFYKAIYGSKQINILNGTIKNCHIFLLLVLVQLHIGLHFMEEMRHCLVVPKQQLEQQDY